MRTELQKEGRTASCEIGPAEGLAAWPSRMPASGASDGWVFVPEDSAGTLSCAGDPGEESPIVGRIMTGELAGWELIASAGADSGTDIASASAWSSCMLSVETVNDGR